MYVKLSRIRKKIREYGKFMFDSIENNNNTDFEKNGEAVFLENLFKYWSKNNRHVVVFDVGSNTGEYLKMIKKNIIKYNICAEVHAFEPMKSAYQLLEKKYSDKMFILNNFGASDCSETVTLYFDKLNSGLASIYKRSLDFFGISLDLSETIDVVRLDQYVVKKQISHIDYIKFDVEGHELFALKGLGELLKNQSIDFIQFEYGGANLDSKTYLKDLFEIFEKSKYRVAKILPRGIEERKYHPFMENFSYSNFVAISSKVAGL